MLDVGRKMCVFLSINMIHIYLFFKKKSPGFTLEIVLHKSMCSLKLNNPDFIYIYL